MKIIPEKPKAMPNLIARLISILLAGLLFGAGCNLNASEARKKVQDLSEIEKEALFSLVVKIYKEAFGVIGPGDEQPKSGGYRTALFQGVMIYALPSNLDKRLDRPIQSVSMHSGFVWDSSKDVRNKISTHVSKWSVQIKSSGSPKTLRIIKYEIDHMPGSPGFGSSLTTITIIPIEVGISDTK